MAFDMLPLTCDAENRKVVEDSDEDEAVYGQL